MLDRKTNKNQKQKQKNINKTNQKIQSKLQLIK